MHGSFLDGKGTVKCGSPCTTSTDTVAAGGGVEVAGILLLEDTKELEVDFGVSIVVELQNRTPKNGDIEVGFGAKQLTKGD